MRYQTERSEEREALYLRRERQITADLVCWERRDAVLAALLRVWLQRSDPTLEWVAKSYLKLRWDNLETLLAQVGGGWLEDARRLWPQWKEPAGAAIIPCEQDKQARDLIAMGAAMAEQLQQMYLRWIEICPPQIMFTLPTPTEPVRDEGR